MGVNPAWAWPDTAAARLANTSQREVFMCCSRSFLLHLYLSLAIGRRLEKVALYETKIHQLCIFDRVEPVQFIARCQRLRRGAQGVGLVVTRADDGKHDAVPAFDEIIMGVALVPQHRSEEHTSELQSLMRISYAVFCLKTKTPP